MKTKKSKRGNYKPQPKKETVLLPVTEEDLCKSWSDYKEGGGQEIEIDLSDIEDSDFLEELERRISKANKMRDGYKFIRSVADCFDDYSLRDAVSDKAMGDDDFRINLIADLDVKPHEASEFVDPSLPHMEDKTRLIMEAVPEIPYNILCDMLRPYLKYTIV